MKRRHFIGMAALALALAGGATTYAAASNSNVAQAISTQLNIQNGPNNQGPGRGPGGQVVSVSGTTITVTNPHGNETIATTSSTTFTLDGSTSSLVAMKAGLYIHVEGSKASDGTFTATKVVASTTQPARPAEQRPRRGPNHGPGGQVASVSGTTITVTNPRGNETIATTSSTTFTLDGATSSLAAMKAGLYIHAEGSKATDGTFTATKVVASATQPARPQDGGRPGR